MKTRSIILSILFLFGTVSLFAQNVTKKFIVKGNCEMCEKRIETAAKAVDGVTLANWDKDTKMMEVAFDSTITNLHKVQMAIAGTGHDTPMLKAKDEVYNNLPKCCRYDRSESKLETDEYNDHKHQH